MSRLTRATLSFGAAVALIHYGVQDTRLAQEMVQQRSPSMKVSYISAVQRAATAETTLGIAAALSGLVTVAAAIKTRKEKSVGPKPPIHPPLNV